MVKNVLGQKMQKAITVKNLINKGVSTREICKRFGVNKQYVSYWRHNNIEETHYRKKKLPIKYIKWMIDISKDKPVSECSSRNMSRIINKKLKEDHVKDSKGVQLKIGYRTVNNLLNKFISRPRKIRKVFFLTKEQKKKS